MTMWEKKESDWTPRWELESLMVQTGDDKMRMDLGQTVQKRAYDGETPDAWALRIIVRYVIINGTQGMTWGFGGWFGWLDGGITRTSDGIHSQRRPQRPWEEGTTTHQPSRTQTP